MTDPLLIDTDPGCDDALALLLALERPEIDLVGLTTVFGNTTTEGTTRNARAILELFDRTDVPVAAGAAEPLLVELDTAEHIHGEGGIRGPLPEPTAATAPVDVHAAQFIVEQARKHDGDLRLAAVGRLTNVALALALEPDLPELLSEVLVMGGSAFVPGNITPLASANFHGDPHAARKVIRDTDPTVVGVDVTEDATLPADWIDSIPRESARGECVHAWCTYYAEEDLARYGIETAAIHDALAVAAVADPSVIDTERYHMEVGADEGLARGALACDAQGVTGEEPNGAFAVEADLERYREMMRRAVAGALE